MGGVWLVAMWWSDAHAGKATKVDKALAAWESGDTEALGDALERAGAALEKAPDDVAVRVAAGRVYVAIATHPGGPTVDGNPFDLALAQFESASAQGLEGAPRAGLESSLPTLESALVAELTNNVEGKQWKEAAEVVALASRSLALSQQLGIRDDARSATFEKLATRVAAHDGDLAGARAHYQKLHDLTGVWDASLGAMVARKTADGGAVQEAIDFLTPIADAEPTDEALLRSIIDLFLLSQKPADAIARLDGVRDRLVASKSGAVLLGELYAKCGDEERSRRAYEALLEQEPTHVQANLSMSRTWLDAARAKVAGLDPERIHTRPTRETKQALTEIADLLSRAEKHARTACETDVTALEPQRLLLEVLKERLARLPNPPKTTAEKDAVAALQKLIAPVEAKIAELEAGSAP